MLLLFDAVANLRGLALVESLKSFVGDVIFVSFVIVVTSPDFFPVTSLMAPRSILRNQCSCKAKSAAQEMLQ